MVPAPHLPNKTCRIDTYYRLQNVRWILLFALLAFVAGGSAALMLTVWVLPADYNSMVLTSGRLESGRDALAQPDQVFVRQIKERLLTIYDIRQKAGEFYSRSAYVAPAAVISSDGWAVAYVANFYGGLEKNFVVLDNNNNNLKIEKVVYDKISQLVYFKIKANGWRVITFPTWLEVNVGLDLWSAGFGNWQPRFIKGTKELSVSKDSAIWQPHYSLVLNEGVNTGDLLLNNNGDLVGVVGTGGLVIPGSMIERQISSLLSAGKIVYQGLPYQGYLVYNFGASNAISGVGFYVDKSTTRATSSTLGVGDVIFEINNQPLDRYHLAEQIWQAPEIVPMKVWRKGTVVQVEVKKQMVE